MKNIRAILIVVAIVSFIVWSNDPIDDTVNFIIGGSIPGTKSAVGFWPIIGFVAILFWLLKRAVTSIRLQLLEHTAQQIKEEKMKDEFVAQHSTPFDPQQRSVIAAPTNSRALS